MIASIYYSTNKASGAKGEVMGTVGNPANYRMLVWKGGALNHNHRCNHNSGYFSNHRGKIMDPWFTFYNSEYVMNCYGHGSGGGATGMK